MRRCAAALSVRSRKTRSGPVSACHACRTRVDPQHRDRYRLDVGRVERALVVSRASRRRSASASGFTSRITAWMMRAMDAAARRAAPAHGAELGGQLASGRTGVIRSADAGARALRRDADVLLHVRGARRAAAPHESTARRPRLRRLLRGAGAALRVTAEACMNRTSVLYRIISEGGARRPACRPSALSGRWHVSCGRPSHGKTAAT